MKTLLLSHLRLRWYFRLSIDMIWFSTSRFDYDDPEEPEDGASFLGIASHSKRWH
jgi:hypothetical protein